jgi:hypothetical protein
VNTHFIPSYTVILTTLIAQPHMIQLNFLSIHDLYESRPCNDDEDMDELGTESHKKRPRSPSPVLSHPQPEKPQSHANRRRAAKRRLEREQATQGGELTVEDVDMSPSPSPSVDSESIESSTASQPSISQPEHKQSRSNKHRAAKRKEEGNKGRNLQFQAMERHVFNSKHIPIAIDASSFEYPTTEFLGNYRTKKLSLKEVTEDLGFEVIPWDGKKATAICDTNNRVTVVLAGDPMDESYASATVEVYQALKRETKANPAIGKPQAHRRGSYYGLTCGISHGNGTLSPINLKVNENAKPTLQRLLGDKNVQRMAGHASATLNYWACALWQRYSDALEMTMKGDTSLEKPFPGSVYPCSTFNFGPDVWTYIHRDSQNAAQGFCAIQALGDFDYRKGGHLVLWDLKVVIEFPPGSLILIPSALLYHSNLNIAIQDGEERASFTHFYPAGLLRFAETGMQTDKSACEGLAPEEKREKLKKLKAERFERDMECMPIWNL